MPQTVPAESLTRIHVQQALDAKTKPPGALGRLEALALQIALLQQTLAPTADPARVVVFAADHGVTVENVSAYPAAVTAQMVATAAAGGAAVAVMARALGASVELWDVGVAADLSGVAGIRHAKVRMGTRNFVAEPAMTAAECAAALGTGRAAATEAARAGVRTLILGEMGIGNTTSASALAAALVGLAPASAVGRGTGVDEAGLARKAEAVRRALARGVPTEPLDVLASVGGFEIAAIAGAMLAAPSLGLVVLVDGFIASAAALVAVRHDPAVLSHLVAAHRSAEAAHAAVLDALGLAPLLDLGLRLGEGTGAVLALPIVRAACAVLAEMATFSGAGVSGPVEATLEVPARLPVDRLARVTP